MTCEEMIYSNEYVDLLINDFSRFNGELESYQDGCITSIEENISVVQVPRTRESPMNLERVPYSFIPKLYGLMDTANLDATGVTAVQNENRLNLSGKNVMVGIIDTGIDYENPLFWNEVNGRKISRIEVIWDQTIQRLEKSDNEDGDRFAPFGTVYEKSLITEALNSAAPEEIVPSKDVNGHGTFLAGVTAGNKDIDHDFIGIAPESLIAVVKLKEAKPYLREYFGVEDNVPAYSETDLIFAVQFLLELARRHQKPISILMGTGSSNGGHSGQTFLERYLDAVLKNIGIMVSVPAGNEGNARLHYRGVFEEGEVLQQIELNVAENQKTVVLEFWGKSPTTFSFGLVSPQGERIEKIPPRFGQEELIYFPTEGSSVYVAYQLIETYSGDELIFVRISKPTSGIWRLIIYADEGRKREYDIWLPLRQFQKPDTYFIRSEPENTVTNPGNGSLTMTLSAYNHLNGSVYVESGRGFNSLNRVVPDLVAPGVSIMGPGLRNNYVTKTGTSVAAAHSAGMYALFFQWDLEHIELGSLFAGQIKSLFLKNAVRLPENIYPNPITGYGYMNIERVFDSFRVVGG